MVKYDTLNRQHSVSSYSETKVMMVKYDTLSKQLVFHKGRDGEIRDNTQGII